MEILIKCPGLHHIIEKGLMFLDKESISSFRILNQDCRNIVDCPRFYLKKLEQLEDVSTELITDWQKLAKNITNEDIERKMSSELFKQFCRGFYKSPLKFVFDEGNFNDSFELVSFILENSDPNNFVHVYVEEDGYENEDINYTPLHLASYFGFVQVAKNMITNGCPANNADAHGITPIQIAADRGQIEIVKTLMKATLTPNIAGNDGWTPIHSAAQEGHIEIVELLMTVSDNPNVADNDGWTPIHSAVQEGHIEIVKLLMVTTDDPNVADNNGETAIHIATSIGHFEAVKLLMAKTQNPNVPNNFGETPIALALQGYHIWIVLLLRIRAFLRMISKLEQIYNFLKLNQYWDYFMLLFSFLILYLLDHLPWYMSCNERM